MTKDLLYANPKETSLHQTAEPGAISANVGVLVMHAVDVLPDGSSIGQTQPQPHDHPVDHLDDEFDFKLGDEGMPAWLESITEPMPSSEDSDEEDWRPLEDILPHRQHRALDRDKVAPFSESLDLSEQARRFAEVDVVKHAPRLKDIVSDASRTNQIRSIDTTSNTDGRNPNADETVTVQSEHDAAADFEKFLLTFIETSEHDAETPPEMRERAKDMLENLTFIGERERTEAVNVMGEYWKEYLRQDPARQICAVVTAHEKNKVKSGAYLLESILGTFSEAELEELGGRIVTDISGVTSRPEDTKIILADDWIISGLQMKETVEQMLNTDAYGPYADVIEINLVTSTAQRIEDGFSGVPVKSYYLSHDAVMPTEQDAHGGYETGAHSSVDFNFEHYVASMLKRMQSMKSQNLEGSGQLHSTMPGLTTIVRPYRDVTLTRLQSIQERGLPHKQDG